MKLIVTIFTCCCAFFQAGAQMTDTATGKIYYTFRHMTDSAAPGIFREENMILLMAPRLNAYLSLDKLKRDSALTKQLESGLSNFNINMGGKKLTTTQIFTNKQSQQLVIVEKLFKYYYYTDDYPPIKWQITGEVKDIAKLKCTKAIGYYKGRTYYAWFTTETTLEGAPWKLQGLPGLVLEAHDSRNQVFFLFNGMENIPPGNVVLSSQPAEGIKTTKKDYLQMREAAQNDPIGFINANAAETGTNIKISPVSGSAGNIKPPKPANPVELADD